MINNFIVAVALFIVPIEFILYVIKNIIAENWIAVMVDVLATLVWAYWFIEFVRFYEVKRKSEK